MGRNGAGLRPKEFHLLKRSIAALRNCRKLEGLELLLTGLARNQSDSEGIRFSQMRGKTTQVSGPERDCMSPFAFQFSL